MDGLDAVSNQKPNMFKNALGLCLTLCFASFSPMTTIFADGASPGFATEPLPYTPPIFNATFTLNASGETIVFDGNTVERVAADGTSLQVYGTIPALSFPSFAVLSEDHQYALVGESSQGEIYSIDLKLGTLTLLGSLEFNYDAVIDRDGFAYISAAGNVPFGSNGLYRIDLEGAGTFELVAQVPGFSGPVALEANGDVLLALADSPNRIIRYTSAQLNSGSVLSDLDGQVVSTDWSGLAFMTSDPETGNVVVAEHDYVNFIDPAKIHIVDGDKASSKAIYEAPAGFSIARLQLFGDEVSPAIFDSFQPERGGTLLYSVTDFFSTTERRVIRPKRPSLALAGAGVSGSGSVEIVCINAHPNADIAIAYNLSVDDSPFEVPVFADNRPLFWSLKVPTQALVPSLISSDANGRASFTFNNPGAVLTGMLTFQAAIIDASGEVVGTSPAASL